jgi:divalent metal cation (Fe/Co/Zn/Cd) transporter
VLVPGDWTVQRGHDVQESRERSIATALPEATVFTHLEPLEDPSAWADEAPERADTLPPKSPPLS